MEVGVSAREEIVDERQESQGAGEPISERARIAGVEAGIAAGLVAPSAAAARPGSELLGACEPADTAGSPERAVSPPQQGSMTAYELPDWTGPPTLQVPRVLLDLDDEATADRGGPQRARPMGPVWRERKEDWDDTDGVLADLANAGFGVTASEEPSSDDPFAYDFLDLDDETSWLAPPAVPGVVAPLSPGAESPSQEAEEPVAPPTVAPQATSRANAGPGPGHATPPVGSDDALVAPVAHRHRRRAAFRVRLPRLQRTSSDAKNLDSAGRNPVVATLTGLVLAGVLLFCFLAGPPAVLALVALALTLATAELFSSLRLGGYRPATLLALVGVPGVTIAAYFRGPEAILFGFVVLVALATTWYLFGVTRREPLVNLSVTVFGFSWLGVLGAFAGLLVDPRIFPHRHGIAFMLGAAIAAVGYDIGGYAVGSRLGRHNLAPSVSPHKSWEGLVAGCVVAIGASVAVTSHIHPWSLGTALGLGVVVAVVAPFGDLVESMIKRDLDVKDMGSLLPGHGGMLDRIDALLFVLPAAYFFVRLAHVG